MICFEKKKIPFIYLFTWIITIFTVDKITVFASNVFPPTVIDDDSIFYGTVVIEPS